MDSQTELYALGLRNTREGLKDYWPYFNANLGKLKNLRVLDISNNNLTVSDLATANAHRFSEIGYVILNQQDIPESLTKKLESNVTEKLESKISLDVPGEDQLPVSKRDRKWVRKVIAGVKAAKWELLEVGGGIVIAGFLGVMIGVLMSMILTMSGTVLAAMMWPLVGVLVLGIGVDVGWIYYLGLRPAYSKIKESAARVEELLNLESSILENWNKNRPIFQAYEGWLALFLDSLKNRKEEDEVEELVKEIWQRQVDPEDKEEIIKEGIDFSLGKMVQPKRNVRHDYTAVFKEIGEILASKESDDYSLLQPYLTIIIRNPEVEKYLQQINEKRQNENKLIYNDDQQALLVLASICRILGL